MVERESHTGADLFVAALEQYGVQHVFGNPGTTELPVIEAITRSDECQYVLALQEDIATGMAAGYAKTRQYHAHHEESVCPVGVVNLHAAPGLAHGLGNLHGASFAGAPLVVTAGIQRQEFRHEEPILGGDLVEMADQFTKWSAEVSRVEAMPAMLRRAFRVALTPPTGPVFLSLPLDVVLAGTDADPEPLGSIPDAGRGDADEIERAAALLEGATEPVLVLGDGVARAGPSAIEAAVELAEAAGARVHAEILGGEVNFPGDHPQWVSYLPPDGEVVARALETDTVVFVGTTTNTTITKPAGPLVPDDAVCIHVNADPWEAGKNQPADAAIVGDPGSVLSELAGLVRSGVPEDERRRRIDRVQEVKTARSGKDERREDGPEQGMDPGVTKEELVETLRAVAPDAYVVDESVTTKYVLLDRWPLSPEQFTSTKGGGLGYGLPSSVGSAIAEALRPNPRTVVGFVGDGSFLYYPQTLYTAARYDVDITFVVPDNRSYEVLKRNLLDILGGERTDYWFDRMGIDFDPRVDIPGTAESQGVPSTTVTDRAALEPTLEAVVDRDGPELVDVLVRE